jgi:putative membrane protein
LDPAVISGVVMVEPQHQAGKPVEEGPSLARYRTRLALDRTTLAWVRTALSMVGFGFGTVAFFRTLQEHYPGDRTRWLHGTAISFGFALLFLGLFALALAAASHWRSFRALKRGLLPEMGQWPLSLTLALILAILGLVGLGLLLTS